MIELRDDQLQALDRETQPVSAGDPCRTIEEVTVGEATYRLRKPLTLTFSPSASDGQGELISQPENEAPRAADISGFGTTFDEARSNWAQRLHARVQSLLAKRPWERTVEEVNEMAIYERTIDFPTYHRETPYRVRQIGTVTRCSPIPDEIQWEDSQLEHVHLSQMPAEFAALHAGQRFEAIVVRAHGGELLHVTFVSPLPPLPESSPSQAEWEELPKSTDSPRIPWDELK